MPKDVETTQSTSYIMTEKIKKVEELKAMDIEPYGRYFDKKDDIIDILKHKEASDKVFVTAGRIISYRRMGKNGFAHLKDETGKIQFYVQKMKLENKNTKYLKI